MIILVITIIFVSVFLFFKVVIKQPQGFWRINLPDVIQLLMFFSLIISVYLTNISINEQKNYNINALRPWLQVMIDSTTHNPLYYDKNGFLRIEYTLTNKGQTPALNVKSYLCPDFTSIYPESVLLSQINSDTNSKKVSIFQGCSDNMISSQMRLMGAYGFEAKTKTGEIESLMIGEAEIKTIKDLFDGIDKSNTKLHVHIYTEYTDVNKNIYANRSSFFLRPNKADSIYGLEVFLVECSQEKIKRRLKK